MGRPLNKKFMGDPNLATRTYPALTLSGAWMLGQTALSTNAVYILKQTGSNRYLATDGTVSGIVTLVGATPANPGEGTILVTPYSASTEGGAIFTFTYKVIGATVVTGHAGTGYAVNDTLTMANGAVLRVATITGSAIATLTVTTAGSAASVTPSTANAVTQVSSSGAGTGAQINLSFALNTATVTGGTNYTSGEAITFVGMTATTMPTATITGVTTGGVPTGVTIGNVGAGITQSASSATGSNPAPTEYARSIKNRSVKTWSDNVYTWDPFNTPTVVGQASLPLSGNGSESTTYNTAYEAAIINGSPYFDSNQGVSAKTAQIYATAGTPGGSGSSSQSAAVAGGSTGVYNPSSTQRRAPTETRTMRMARLAEEKAAKEKKSNDEKLDENKPSDDNKSPKNRSKNKSVEVKKVSEDTSSEKDKSTDNDDKKVVEGEPTHIEGNVTFS